MGARSLVFLFAVSFAVANLQAKPLPSPDEFGSPAETAILVSLHERVERSSGPEEALRHADAALISLPNQTAARGLLQYARAGILSDLDRLSEAQKAVDESVRLLPSYSAPLLLGGMIYTFSARPETAATLYLRATRLDPEHSRTISSYDVNALRGRLINNGDHANAGILAERLIEIGWEGDDLGTKSSLVKSLVERKLADKDYSGASALVPQLFDPTDMYQLLQLKAAQPIWGDIEAWAGPKLEKQWPIYLREARDRWDANPSAEATRDYLDALSAADHHATIIRELLPRFRSSTDAEQDYDLVFGLSSVAKALAEEKRWQDIDDLYGQFEKLFPIGSDANALNLPFNRGRYLLLSGRANEAYESFKRGLTHAEEWGDELNRNAIVQVHQRLVCAAVELNRQSLVTSSMAFVQLNARENPVITANMYLCLSRMDDARSAMMLGLEREGTRISVLQMLQPRSRPAIDSAYGRKESGWWQTLQSDKLLLAAARKHGRVLPFALSDGAPPESVRTVP